MNVLVLNGSPKAKSDTMRMTRSFLEGLTAHIHADVTIVDVIKKNIRPCIGCFGCWARGEGKCVIEDDQNEILAAYQKADTGKGKNITDGFDPKDTVTQLYRGEQKSPQHHNQQAYD